MANKILDMLGKVQAAQTLLKSHLANQFDMEVKEAYLSGLALVAAVDGDIVDKERAYLELLLRSFAMPPDTLEGLLAFASEPDQETLSRLPTLIADEKLKKVFLLDCIVIAKEDGKVSEDEILVRKQFRAMLGVSAADIEEITKLSTLIECGDVKAIFGYAKANESLGIDIYQHLLELKNISIDDYHKSIKKAFINQLNFQFIDVACLENGTKLMKDCVTMAHFSAYLQYLLDLHELSIEWEMQRLTFADNIMLDVLNLDASSASDSSNARIAAAVVKSINDSNVFNASKHAMFTWITYQIAEHFAHCCSVALGKNFALPVIDMSKESLDYPSGTEDYIGAKEGSTIHPAIISSKDDSLMNARGETTSKYEINSIQPELVNPSASIRLVQAKSARA